MKLDNNIALQSTFASLLVIFGVVTKNSFEQMGQPDHPIAQPIGMTLFVIGWLYVAYVLSIGKNKALFFIPALLILGSVLMMKKHMNDNQQSEEQIGAPVEVPMVYPATFALAWLVLGFAVGNHLSGAMKYLGLLATLFVLVSMMNMLPYQRENCVVDGPGMPLFVIAWGIIVFLNASRK
jgi:hypothetical protein